MNYAAIFPGQGSHKIGMLLDLSKKYDLVKNIFFKASSILGYNLWNLIQKGPLQKLNQTKYNQPVILTSSIVLWNLWINKYKYKPILLAGHSLGEYSALVCSKSLNFNTALKLVEYRGKIMQENYIAKKGYMCAIIGLDINIITKICKKLVKKNEIVIPSVLNSPKQIIISGNLKSVKAVSLYCKKNGAKNILVLPITVPSHCVLMKNASKKLSNKLNKIKIFNPKIPILNNINAKIIKNKKMIYKSLIYQLYKPIQWIKIIKFIKNKNIKILIEIGYGNTLKNIIKDNNKKLKCLSIYNIKLLNLSIKNLSK